MKLKNIANSEDLYINEECYYISRFHMSILNNKGKKIGEVFGHLIDTEKVAADLKENSGSNFFIELDCISQLLCDCADYIINQFSLKTLQTTHNILFLNRLSLNKEYLSDEKEIEALNLLFEYAETIIYSFGRTELDDDFPEQDNDNYFDNYGTLLEQDKWNYNEKYGFYIKIRNELWTKDKIMNRLCEPFKKIKLKGEEFPFWIWFLTDITECEEDYIICEDSEEYDNDVDTKLSIFQYDYAKSYLNSLREWDKSNEKIYINISPLLFPLFLEYIEWLKECREKDSCIEVCFSDPEVENNIDAIVKKYYKLFYKMEKEHYFDYVYAPILSKYFKEADEFTLKKIQTIYTEIKNSRQNVRL